LQPQENNKEKNNDDLEFINNFRKNRIGKMDWALCLKPAHEKKPLQTFFLSGSIRHFYRDSTKK
jgi:hypothetical protein